MAATLADDTFKYKFVDENVLISIKLSLKFVPYGPINKIPELVQYCMQYHVIHVILDRVMKAPDCNLWEKWMNDA